MASGLQDAPDEEAGTEPPGLIRRLPGRRRRDGEERVPAERVPQSPAAWHPCHALTLGTFSREIPPKPSSRSKEDIAPWLAPGLGSSPAITNLLCGSGGSPGSWSPGTDQHAAAHGAGVDSDHAKTPHTIGMEGSAKTACLAPHKENSEEKGAKAFVEYEPHGLDVEFFSRLKHLSTPATRRRLAKPWLKGK